MSSEQSPQAATVAAYDADAARYAAERAVVPDSVRADIEELAGALAPGSRVLEIGSGSGRDADLMESLGLCVQRTDITPGFVRILRERGHAAVVLDPLTDDLASPEGPYDAVWASASLLHVARRDLGRVLARLLEVTRPGGVLRFSVKEGDGEEWSTHGPVGGARHFVYWRAAGLRDAVAGAGWASVRVEAGAAGRDGDQWLEVWAVRP